MNNFKKLVLMIIKVKKCKKYHKKNNYKYKFQLGSEHKLDGKKFPLELHIVHSSATGQIAVLAVLFQVTFLIIYSGVT